MGGDSPGVRRSGAASVRHSAGMAVRRIMPYHESQDFEATRTLLHAGARLGGGHFGGGYIGFGSGQAQVVFAPPGVEPVLPDMGVDVDSREAVDAAHAEAVQAGHEVLYGPVDEPWAVRRFFVRDPHGVVISVLARRVIPGLRLARLVVQRAPEVEAPASGGGATGGASSRELGGRRQARPARRPAGRRARMPRSPTGRTSGRPRWKIRNMSAVHWPRPLTAVSCAVTSSSGSSARRSSSSSPSTTCSAKRRR